MNKTKIKIGVLTGGGDCSGINAAVKWIVKTALDPQLEEERGMSYTVMGIRDGWKGLAFTDNALQVINANIIPLNEGIVRTWDRYGGTNLGTSRFNPYNSQRDASGVVLNNIKSQGLDVLIAIGDVDTLSIAAKVASEGVKVIGIPKTIDNDVVGTEYCLGFETALEVITDIVDKLRTTAGSHRRIFIVETMGSSAGWLALEGGESCGAYIILIPEWDFSIERVCELIIQGRKAGSRYDIIVIAEGAKIVGGKRILRDDKVDMFGSESLGGVGEYLSSEINNALGLETRSIALGHVQRGGTPCAFDRRMGRYFGIAAVDLIVQNDFGQMVSYREDKFSSVPLKTIAGKIKFVNVETMYDTRRYNGIRTIFSGQNIR
jgi:6-phosphofructokinase